MRNILILVCSLIIAVFSSTVQAFEGLFYLNTHSRSTISVDQQMQDFDDHANLINVIAPRFYIVDVKGNLANAVDEELINTAAENHVKVMPFIVNLDSHYEFDQKALHNFLKNPTAKQQAIAAMLAQCKKYHYYGLQFDFENILASDKNAYTQFVGEAATALHKEGFLLSLAVMPRLVDAPTTKAAHWAFDNWLGAYDYGKLAQHADFLSVMTYNRNDETTTPGPIAPLAWTEEVVKHILADGVPPQKISVGLITYSGFWTVNSGRANSRIRYSALEYSQAAELLKTIPVKPQWDAEGGSNYYMYSEHGLYSYFFPEDKRAFQAKLDFIKRYNLRGFSMYRLGLEDPGIWQVLAKYKK